MKSSSVVNRSLDILLQAKSGRDSLRWIAVHIVILGVLLYDISNKCPFAFSRLFYIEYFAAGIVLVSLLYYLAKYLYNLFIWKPVVGTADQRRLLKFDEKDNSFIVDRSDKISSQSQSPVTKCRVSMSYSTINWNASYQELGNNSFNVSNYTGGANSSAANLSRDTNHQQQPSASTNNFTSPYKLLTANEDLYTDANSLQGFLENVSDQECVNLDEDNNQMNGNAMTTFWNHKLDDFVGLLKTSKYQLSPTSTNVTKQQSLDESGLFGTSVKQATDLIISACKGKVSSAKLSHCITNLKRWISGTILERLSQEIQTIDAAFKAIGFSDLRIGHVGLDRLKKTTENHLATSRISTLPLIIPYLELTANQEYLVNRIKELSKGTCIAEYHCPMLGTMKFNSTPWDDQNTPTDAAIIFHLFCTYMDSQLMPLPQPGGRPFYDRYVMVGEKKSHTEIANEIKNKTRCAILCSNLMKPTFNFVSDKIHDSVADRNNLFHVITQFLVYIKTNHGGYLESVNLGKSGVNILCIVGD